MNTSWKRTGCLSLVSILLVVSAVPGFSQEPQADDQSPAYVGFGGPDSAAGQMADDARLTESLTGVEARGYFDWKDHLAEKHGFRFSVDYTSLFVGASNALGDTNSFASGAVRFFGTWDLVGRDSGNTGTFVWKVENRHKYADLPASATASAIGYVGGIYIIHSDAGTRLTNLYWKQSLNRNRINIIVGMLDTTDWIDIYALGSPWVGFANYALGTGGAAIPWPDDASLGAFVGAMLTDNVYVTGGFADANAIATDPFKTFDTFFDDNEYFKAIELGWITSQDRYFLDNTHLTYWHSDERVGAGVSKGWGAAFSATRSYGERWMPFLQAGYTEGGGTFLQKTVTTGIGYHFKDDVSLLGAGFNWGQPNEDTYGEKLGDQYAVELFTRLQIARFFQLTPAIQYIGNPALNPEANHSWVLSVRSRFVF